MTKIHILPPNLANKIAAGEVVERPASVVKELVENSIDAGATKIIVEIENGGLNRIKVSDNGEGMTSEDAKLCFKRHATSKIEFEKDLYEVVSLGFRGEAIASIASVSQVILQTKQKNSLEGLEIENLGGDIKGERPCGCPEGTIFEINNLFFNTPVRKKYLKTIATEFGHIANMISNIALGFPHVAFRLSHNKQVLFDLPGNQKMNERIFALLGREIYDSLLPIEAKGPNISVSGFLTKPNVSRSNRNHQYLFVNQRAISSQVISRAIYDAFHSLLPDRKYPIFVLNIEINPLEVDVNIHPRKLEVKFLYQQEVYSFVKNACKKVLEENVLAPQVKFEMPDGDTGGVSGDSFNAGRLAGEKFGVIGAGQVGDGKMSSGAGGSGYGLPSHTGRSAGSRPYGDKVGRPDLRTVKQALDFTKNFLLGKSETGANNFAGQSGFGDGGLGADTTTAISSKTKLIPVAQIKNSYIVAHDEGGIVLIDQHAAHERINYMKLMKGFNDDLNKGLAVQRLITPINVDLTINQAGALAENLEIMTKLGFEIEHFGGNTYLIQGIPAIFVKIKDDVRDILIDTIDDLANEKIPAEVSLKKEHIINYIACRSSVKFGQVLGRNEQIALIAELEGMDQQYTCPHGRPTMIRLDFGELEKRFLRG